MAILQYRLVANAGAAILQYKLAAYTTPTILQYRIAGNTAWEKKSMRKSWRISSHAFA